MDAEAEAALDAEIEACIAEMRMEAEECMKEAEEEEEEQEEEERRTAESRSTGKKMKTEKAARVKKKKVAAEASRKKTTVTREVDLAAAAAYRAEAEEAHRNGQPALENAALNKWIATGDIEAQRCRNRWIAEEVDARCRLEDEEWSDPNARHARMYRDMWNELWAGADARGSYEDTTPIPPMRYTDKKPNHGTVGPTETLQVYSVRLVGIKEGLHWPLEVFGVVAVRDVLDRNRNIIFHRERDNYQTIHEENPYLILTGPTRAVVLFDPACLEVDLRVKGTTESEDKDLSFLVSWCMQSSPMKSWVTKCVEASKLSTVELTLGYIACSVEATISVRVIAGKWPDGFRGVFIANTTSLESMKVSLLAFEDDNLPVAADGTIQLSRRVVCVEFDGELRISVMARCDEGQVVEKDSKAFNPKEASRSYDMLEVPSCKMEVTVAWSLPSDGLY